MRRRQATALFATALAAISMAALAAPVGAQQFDAPLTVTKVVEGDVPADAAFTIVVECDDPAIVDGGGGDPQSSIAFEFGPEGGSETIGFVDGTVCFVTETVNGGASATTYDCEANVPVCGAPTAEGVAVEVSDEGQDVDVTVTNTFETAPPAPEEAAEAAVVVPRFTG